MKLTKQICFTLTIFFSLFTFIKAADGDLDTTFNGTGIHRTQVGDLIERGRATAIQSDGKIIVAGPAMNSALIDGFGVARYNADGSIDTTFAGSGNLIVKITTNNTDEASAVALQADGKILVGGHTTTGGTAQDFALIRLNTNGTLDTSFDGDGIVTTSFSASNDGATSLVIQPDGKIVAAGYTGCCGPQQFAAVRYNTNGTLDTTFDTDGKVNVPIGINIFGDRANSVALQSDGKIVLAGSASNSNQDFACARLNSDGSLDTTFDGDGKVSTAVATASDSANAVVIQADGKIVLGGNVTIAGGDAALVRYNANGSLDTSFDTDGIVITNFLSTERITSLQLLSDGKILGGGQIGSDFAVYRYNTNGSLDTTFDSDGRNTISFTAFADIANGIAMQADGKIVAVGQSSNGGTDDFAIARLNSDGSIDNTFDGDGKATMRLGSRGEAKTVAMQSDGKIVVAGDGHVITSANSLRDFVLARYNTNGTLDTTFGDNGRLSARIGTNSNVNNNVSSMAIQPDGKIVVVGIADGSNFAVARFNANGSLV